MRKVITALTFICISFVCGQSSYAQSTPSTARESSCPEGTREVWSYQFNEFRFKRPKYNCERGFWFCVNASWSLLGCKDDSGVVHPATPTLTQRGGTIVAFPHKTENIVTILFPYELVNKPGNNVEDFKVFNVDEEISIGGMKLKKGDYPTKFNGNEIIVDVPFY